MGLILNTFVHLCLQSRMLPLENMNTNQNQCSHPLIHFVTHDITIFPSVFTTLVLLTSNVSLQSYFYELVAHTVHFCGTGVNLFRFDQLPHLEHTSALVQALNLV